MRVLLVNPPPPIKERYFVTPPLGLMYLASTLRSFGHQVKILDLFSFGEDTKMVSDTLERENIEVVGITGMSLQHNQIQKTAETSKNVDSEGFKVIGQSNLLNLLITLSSSPIFFPY